MLWAEKVKDQVADWVSDKFDIMEFSVYIVAKTHNHGTPYGCISQSKAIYITQTYCIITRTRMNC